jgi:phospholipid transport system substrate-binding protein
MLKKIIISSLLLLTPLLAIPEAEINTKMTSTINNITAVLQNKSLSLEDKKSQILPEVDGLFNYTTMSKISLGNQWKTLSETEKEAFISKFENKLKNSYFEKLELYTDQKVNVTKVEKVKPTRIKLYAEIVGDDETYELIYKFYKVKNTEDWLIYDVEITGVSIIQTYRKQFTEFLKTKPFSELVASL